jgi:hypothetical protein
VLNGPATTPLARLEDEKAPEAEEQAAANG